MHLLFAILIFSLLSIAALGEQGTMSTDDSSVSGSAASLSGFNEDQIDLRDEEVQMQEDDYDPSVDSKPIEVESDKEKMDQYQDEVYED